MNKNYINIKKLEKIINLGFFKSTGGVSTGNYSSLNCSKSNRDNKNSVDRNINISINQLGVKNKKLKLISQIHSDKIFFITKKNYKNKIYGDGLISQDKNFALGVLTADCAPIFIFDKKKSIICCLHSGWRGTLKNIVGKTIRKFETKKIKLNDIIAVIGPCLGMQNYEVDKNFKIKFINKNRYYFKFFKSKNKNKDLFDLRSLINFQLKCQGVGNIYNIKKDTYKHSQSFFSHRRSIHQNKVNTGRMINIISFRD